MRFSGASLLAVIVSLPSLTTTTVGCPYLQSQGRRLNEEGKDEVLHHDVERDLQRFGTRPIRGGNRGSDPSSSHDCNSYNGDFCYGTLFPRAPRFTVHGEWDRYIRTGTPDVDEADGTPPYMDEDAIFNGPRGPREDEILQAAENGGSDLKPEQGFPDEDELGGGLMGPAGYTYLGQLLSHDVNKDALTQFGEHVSSPDKIHNSENAMVDFSTMYNGHPFDTPVAEEEGSDDAERMGYKFPFTGVAAGDGESCDIPRDGTCTAKYIADVRNDNNRIILMILTVFMKLHNKFYDEFDDTHSSQWKFEEAKKKVVHHWQAVVLYDLLPSLVELKVWKDVVLHRKRYYYKPGTTAYDKKQAPIEFSTCAYRIIHSRVANGYFLGGGPRGAGFRQVFQTNATLDSLEGDRCHEEILVPFPMDRFFDFGLGRNPVGGDTLDVLYSNSMMKMPTDVSGNPDEQFEFCCDTCGTGGSKGCTTVDHAENGRTIASLAIADMARVEVHGVPGGIKLARLAKSVHRNAAGIMAYSKADLANTAWGLPYEFDQGGYYDDVPCLVYMALEAIIEQRGIVMGRFGSHVIAETMVGMVENAPHNILKTDFKSEITGDHKVLFKDVVNYVGSSCFATT